MRFDHLRPSLYAAKSVLASLLLFVQGASHPEASPEHLRFERPIAHAPQENAQACAVLDASVFTHSSPSLKDLRIYSDGKEVPYAVTLSEPLQQDTDDARILNAGSRAGHIVFDLEMPNRPYTAVDLDLAARDFIATAEVSGSQTLGDPDSTKLGTFTLFDLSSQHLSKSTGLPLVESRFPFLHVDLAMTPAPGTPEPVGTLNRSEILKGALVPPSREAQTLYSTTQQTSAIVQRGHETVATLQVPARVPIERIAFSVAPSYKSSFSRPVHIRVRVLPAQATRQGSDPMNAAEAIAEDDGPPSTETTSGTILSVHKMETGREIAYENLAVATAIGANMQRAATLEVAIDNGDDAPLPITSVQLQMRQRRICFDAAVAQPVLYYGDAALEAPVYDYAKLFRPAAAPLIATLAAEAPNASFTKREDTRPFTERHPELLWIVLLTVVCILALTAFRSAKHVPQ